VVIYRLEDGLRTHVLDGHSGSVYCLAPSGDGQWLATGSSDQTIRFWPLAGCDSLAPLGTRFERRDAAVVVAQVDKNGFGDVGGLKAGDVVEEFKINRTAIAADAFLERFAALPPNDVIEMQVRRPGVAAPVQFLTTKRDRPALTLYVGIDQEWVFWMPRGYYDSSVTGDSNHLGWQVNRAPFGKLVATEFFKIRTHERELRQIKGAPGNLLDRLLDTADESVTLGPPPVAQPAEVLTDQPPRVVPLAGAGGIAVMGSDGKAIAPGSPLPEVVRMESGVLAIDWKLESLEKRAPVTFELRVDGRVVRPPDRPALNPATGVAVVPLRQELEPGKYKLMAVARKNDRGVEQAHFVTVEVTGKPRPKPRRLTVVTIAPSFDDPQLPEIKFAARDMDRLPPFFTG
jgi:WD domain, G-beta repeat